MTKSETKERRTVVTLADHDATVTALQSELTAIRQQVERLEGLCHIQRHCREMACHSCGQQAVVKVADPCPLNRHPNTWYLCEKCNQKRQAGYDERAATAQATIAELTAQIPPSERRRKGE